MMFAADYKVVTILRHEYRLNTPAMWKDVEDAMHQIGRDREGMGLAYSDDAVRVIPGDDEIIFYWEEEAVTEGRGSGQ